jgi:superfamily II DNA/RNA helicase
MNQYSKKNKTQRNIVTKFIDLGFSDNVIKAIQDAGYETPTEIQAQAIPAILMTKDVVGIAQTGTGKTASFTLPMIEILAGGRARSRMPRALVLTPTRELAAQVAENFDKYGKYAPLKKALLVGGVSANDQIKALEAGVDVLIATPGRLLDLFERGNILLNDVKMLVIDEADRMLDMGFIPDIERIISLLPQFRQTLLFSATMPDEVKKLTAKFMSNPKTIAASVADKPAETVKQTLVWVNARTKKKALSNILDKTDIKNGFIFCNRKKDISGLVKWLKDKGEPAAGLHGDMQQSRRTETLEDFKKDRIKLMVCSDVAARGLDIKGVSHVINYDVPFNAEDYVHRIGRTGRAGMKGQAFTLAVEKSDDKFVSAIEKIIKKEIPVDNSLVKVEAKKTKASPSARVQKHNNSNDSESDVVGFGDEIPAFMLRSC